MKMKVFCAAVAGQANQPGVSVKNVQMQSIQDTPAIDGKPAVPNPNAKMFREGKGNINVNLINLTKEAASEFEEGKVYIVTIKEAGPND